MKVSHVWNFPSEPVDLVDSIAEWAAQAGSGRESTEIFYGALKQVKVRVDQTAPLSTTTLLIGNSYPLTDLRLSGQVTLDPPFFSTRIASIMRDFRALYRTGRVRTILFLSDVQLAGFSLSARLDPVMRARLRRRPEAPQHRRHGAYKPDLSVTLKVPHQGTDYAISSSVWEVKCSKPSNTVTENKHLWRKGMAQESLYSSGNHEASGGDLGGYLYNMKFMRFKVIPNRSSTLIAFDVDPSFLEDTGRDFRRLKPEEVLDGSLQEYMPSSLDQPQGRIRFWDSFSFAAKRLGQYELDQPPPRLQVRHPDDGFADLLLEEWLELPNVVRRADYTANVPFNDDGIVQQSSWMHAYYQPNNTPSASASNPARTPSRHDSTSNRAGSKRRSSAQDQGQSSMQGSSRGSANGQGQSFRASKRIRTKAKGVLHSLSGR